MSKIPNCIVTDHFMSQKIVSSFAKGINKSPINIKEFKDFSSPIAAYGILRGTGSLYYKVKNFYYIDHGYFPLRREFLKKEKLL